MIDQISCVGHLFYLLLGFLLALPIFMVRTLEHHDYLDVSKEIDERRQQQVYHTLSFTTGTVYKNNIFSTATYSSNRFLSI